MEATAKIVLSQEVCKRCMAVEPCDNGMVAPDHWNPPVPWHEVRGSIDEGVCDGALWKEGKVHCPWRRQEKTFKEALERCPYRLEHFMTLSE